MTSYSNMQCRHSLEADSVVGGKNALTLPWINMTHSTQHPEAGFGGASNTDSADGPSSQRNTTDHTRHSPLSIAWTVSDLCRGRGGGGAKQALMQSNMSDHQLLPSPTHSYNIT